MVSYSTKDHRSRVRNRFINSKSDGLQDYELLEIILFSAHSRTDTRGIAKNIIDYSGGSIKNVFELTLEDLMSIKNVTFIIACSILCVSSIIKRFFISDMKKNLSIAFHGDDYVFKSRNNDGFIKNFTDVVKYVNINILSNRKESFHVIYLNSRRAVIKDDIIGYGSIDYVSVNLRDLVLNFAKYNCRYLIVAHNHPSGNVKPSEGDINFTKKLYNLCEAMSVILIDHLIVTENGFFSFHKEGILKKN